MADDSAETKVCPRCGTTAPADTELCPNCGARLRAELTGSFVWRSCVSVILFGLALVMALFGSCFLLVGASSLASLFGPSGITGVTTWGYSVVFALVGVAILWGAYVVLRAALGRRS